MESPKIFLPKNTIEGFALFGFLDDCIDLEHLASLIEGRGITPFTPGKRPDDDKLTGVVFHNLGKPFDKLETSIPYLEGMAASLSVPFIAPKTLPTFILIIRGPGSIKTLFLIMADLIMASIKKKASSKDAKMKERAEEELQTAINMRNQLFIGFKFIIAVFPDESLEKEIHDIEKDWMKALEKGHYIA